MTDNTEKPIFAAVISSPTEYINDSEWKTNIINKGVPREVIIMQLKALIKNFENSYFSDFDNKIKN